MTDIVKNVASNARPQINIKRKKIVKVQEGHTGAWKVAYADFVTAMMAFFMLMWLMNATTEKQKTGLADYFSPTLSINRSVAGGDNHFKGASVFETLKLAKTGTGQSHAYESTSKTNGTEGHARQESDAENKKLEALEKMIMAPGGESAIDDGIKKHVVTRLTDERLILEFYDRPNPELFDSNSEPSLIMQKLVGMVAKHASLVTNPIAIEAHVNSLPIVLQNRTEWETSLERATRIRQMLERTGFDADRIKRVTGHGDKSPRVDNLMAIRNNRISIIFLRL